LAVTQKIVPLIQTTVSRRGLYFMPNGIEKISSILISPRLSPSSLKGVSAHVFLQQPFQYRLTASSRQSYRMKIISKKKQKGYFCGH
jgi:hypothetical protein